MKLFLFLTFFASCLHSGTGAVTYDLSGGRFGDNLLAYLRARWVSYRYEMPLLYRPFPYSSELALGSTEQPDVDPSLKKLPFLGGSPKEKALYVCPYFSECAWERKRTKEKCYFAVDWKDPGFRKIARELLKPKKELQLIRPPKDKISIAIHFREGGGYDVKNRAASLRGLAVKFPPFEFYVEGLLKTIAQFIGKPLYCFLFTDAPQPAIFLEKLKQAVPKDTQIVFDCRQDGNADDKNVLEDFFSLFLFDALIHSQSNFSLVPSLIHDYAIVYAPLSARSVGKKKEKKMVIDQVKFEVNETIMRALR